MDSKLMGQWDGFGTPMGHPLNVGAVSATL